MRIKFLIVIVASLLLPKKFPFSQEIDLKILDSIIGTAVAKIGFKIDNKSTDFHFEF